MIEIKDVDVDISRNRIVRDVSIHIDEGEFVGVVGPNGSGKSTLLKSVYRVLKPSKGRILICGTDISAMSLKDSAQKTAVVSQHNYCNFDFKVIDVVLMGRSPHKEPMEMDNDEDRRIAESSLERVGMTDLMNRNFYTLSGGEQQRVILARALTQQTSCLILDEPTNHLDIKYQLQLLDLIKDLGLTVLCALHDLNIAAAYCDRLCMMKDGMIYATGKPSDVLTSDVIKSVYGVDVTIEHTPSTGLLNIIYHPGFIKRK